MTSPMRHTMLALSAALMLSVSTAKADDWNHETILTIDRPMEVPGATLMPGTYTFVLADENGSRSAVNIFRGSFGDRELVTTVSTIRMQRSDRDADLKLAVAMTGENTMPLVKGWFYPGSMTGHQFVYAKDQMRQIAQAETVEITVTPRG